MKRWQRTVSATPQCRTSIPNGTEEAVMITARLLLLTAIAVCASASTPAHAQSGLRIDAEAQTGQAHWPRWQARFGLATQASAIDAGGRWQLTAGQLLGDYYWSGLRPAGVGRSSGFRATSGLLLGRRSIALGMPAPISTQPAGITLSRSLRTGSGIGGDFSEPWSAVPYLGIGYSGISLRGGWGFTADVGLAGTAGGLRTRRDAGLGAQGAEDLLRDLRLTPVLQFGASYAF